MSSTKEKYSIREWDALAQELPLELQDVLDRACLERGGKYSETSDLQKDFYNLAKGQPPSSKKDDLIFTLKGYYQRHRKLSLTFLSILLICALVIAGKSSPLNGDKNKLYFNEVSLSEIASKKSTSSDELNELLKKEKDLSEELKLLRERYKNRVSKKSFAQKDKGDIDSKLKGITKKIEDMNGKNKKLNDLFHQLDLQLRTSSQNLEEVQTQNSSPLKKETIHTKAHQAGEFVADYDQIHSKKTLNFLQDISGLDENDWLDQLFSSSKTSPYLVHSLPLPQYSTTFSPHPNKLEISWSSTKNLHKLSFNDEVPQLLSFPLLGNPLQVIHPMPRGFAVWDGAKAFLVKEEITGLTWSPPLEIPSSKLSFITSPNQSINIWTPAKLTLVGHNPVLNQYQVSETTISPEILNIRSNSKGERWFQTEKGIFSKPDSPPIFSPNSPILSWDLSNDKQLFIQTQKGFTIVDPSHPSPKKHWIIPLESQEKLDIAIHPTQAQAWINTKNSLTLYRERKKKQFSDITGSPLLFRNNALITKTEDQLLIYRFPLSEALTPEKDMLLKLSKDSSQNKKWNSSWSPSPSSNFRLILRDMRNIEVWNIEEDKKVCTLAIHNQNLKRVIYSKRLNSLVGLTQKGEVVII
jgi:hypothetical protein